VAGPNKTR